MRKEIMSVENMSSSERFDREYDFSRGIRGKYAKRFADVPGWLRAVAEHDVQRELGETLLKLQQFEASLVAYHALVLDLKPTEAGKAARKLLDDPTGKRSASFWSQFFESAPTMAELDPSLSLELRKLFDERSWVVHRSFHDVEGASPSGLSNVMDRLEQLAAKADFLTLQVYRNLITTCVQAGSSERQVQERAERAIDEWAAA
jgi:hypothetical protein